MELDAGDLEFWLERAVEVCKRERERWERARKRHGRQG